jgi:hypothetical protein
MDARRLKAPDADGALLAAPPLSEAGTRLKANSQALAEWDYDFQGRRSGRLRALARGQILAAARDYLTQAGLDVPDLPPPDRRFVVTGHQPDLFHPGVWVKNFAVAGIAAAQGAVGLNLVVDNDIPKASAIRVPRCAGNVIEVHRVEYDEWGGELPFEELRVRDESTFASFSERVRRLLCGTVDDPLIESFWPLAVAQRTRTDRLGLRFARARRGVESAWGVRNFEVPLSAVCETEAFLWFASHILANLPRFQAVHNAALAEYRALYGIRSRHHPVPALAKRGDWLEAPFWVWHADEPRRRSLLARQLPKTLQLRVDGEDSLLLELPLGPDREACCAVEQLLTLPGRKVRLRTRALTTTMFARLLLGDLFLHGIGGAKYDELGDEVIRRFFGLEPPAYLTMSMTLWLNLGTDPASPERLHALDRTLRDLMYNPERHFERPPDGDFDDWIAAKRRAIGTSVATHPERLARFREIRRCNEALQPAVRTLREQTEAERSSVRAGMHRNAIARSREYPLVLHSESRLRALFTAIATGARTT